MNNFLNDDCTNFQELIKLSLNQKQNSFEIERHLITCPNCQQVWKEDLQVKKMLKKAVKSEFTPQNLINSIRNQIRR
jgi:predicted anti-sigma-YlaC factor YlaD